MLTLEKEGERWTFQRKKRGSAGTYEEISWREEIVSAAAETNSKDVVKNLTNLKQGFWRPSWEDG
ncbi:hypothetical protein [Dysosmobacter sp. Phy]